MIATVVFGWIVLLFFYLFCFLPFMPLKITCFKNGNFAGWLILKATLFHTSVLLVVLGTTVYP